MAAENGCPETSRQYRPRRELLQSVDSYMSTYSKMEETRSREKRQMRDEEGFVTIMKGARGGVVRMEDAKELGEKQKTKNKGLENFYRFQMQKRRKEEQVEFLREFNDDKQRVEEMKKKRRGRLRVSCCLAAGFG